MNINLLHVHIPRTAGKNTIKFFSQFECFKSIRHTRLTNRLAKEYKDWFKFAVVRNPWERIASLFHSEIVANNLGERSYNHRPKLQRIIFAKDLNRYIEFMIKHDPAAIRGTMWYIKDCDNITVDFVGRYENLYEDLEYVCDRVCLNVGVELSTLKYLKETKRPYVKYDYKDFYDEETTQLVADMYKDEIEYFGYEF